MGLLRRALVKYDWCFYRKRKLGHRERPRGCERIRREDHVKTQAVCKPKKGPQRKPNLVRP